MPIIQSAKRAMKQSEVRRKRNYRFREKYKAALKEFQKLVKSKEIDKAKTYLNKVYSVLDTAVKKNILHQNTVSRKKSRLSKMVSSLIEK